MPLDSGREYDLRRADRIILIIATVLICLDIIINILTNLGSLKKIVLYSLPALCTGSIFVGLYFLKIKSLIRGFITALLIFLGAIFLSVLSPSDVNSYMMIFLSIVMVSVYLRKELILAHAIVLNIGLMITYFFAPNLFFHTINNWGTVAVMFLLLNSCFAGLYLLVLNGRSLINEVIRKEAWTKAVFDSVNDALFIHDARTGKILDVNHRMLEMYGVTYEEALDSTPHDFDSGHPDYIPEKAYQKIMLAGKEPEVFEWLGKRKDGCLIWVEVTMRRTKIMYEDRIIVLVRDISERKASENKIKENEERWKAIINTSPDGIAVVDMNGIVKELSLKTPEMCGYSSVDEMIGRNYFEFVAPEYHEKAGYLVSEMLKGNYTGVAEYRILRKDGSSFYSEINAEVLKDSKGVNVGIIFVLRDVSSRKAVEEALQHSEEKFRSLIEQATAGFVLVNETGKVMEWNTAQERIWELAKEEVMGKPFWEIHFSRGLDADRDIEQMDSFRRSLLQGLKTGMSSIFNKNFETVIQKIDGSKRWLNQVMFPIHVGNGFRVAVISHDVTEQKTVEIENFHLNEQLRQSEQLQAIGQLAGGVAHDFNNQLMGILGYSDLIENGVESIDEAKDYARKIALAAKRSADLTAKLLAFAHKGDYLSITVDMHAIIDEVVSLLSHSIDKRIVIIQEKEASPSTVKGDPTQLQNAVLNLALNARDAMQNGGTMLFRTETILLDEAECKKKSIDMKPGEYLLLSVKDTGCGIEKDIRQKIFEPFFTTKKKGGGTGLGLSAVYGTVKGLKGCMTVDSETGKGSMFTLYLPLIHESIIMNHNNDAVVNHLGKRSKTVLLVDDEEDIRLTAALMLQQEGFTVVTCKNGREAVELFTKDPKQFDLVLLDMIMPEMRGNDVFTEIRKIDPQMRVLLATGYSVSEEAHSLMEQGLNGILQKPFTKKELLVALQKVF